MARSALALCSGCDHDPVPGAQHTPPLPIPGDPLECESTPSEQERGTLLVGLNVKTSASPAAGEQGMAVVPGACGSAVVAYSDRTGARETQLRFISVQIEGENTATALPSSNIAGWVNDCAARPDGSLLCAGGLGYAYGPFAGGWQQLLDKQGSVTWSVQTTSAPDAGVFATAVDSAADGSAFVASYQDASHQVAQLDHIATKAEAGWQVEVRAAELEARQLDVAALAAASDGTLLVAGSKLGDAWWSPWLSKQDAAGQQVWSVSIAGKPDTDLLVRDVAVLPSGVGVVAAGFDSTGAGAAASRAGTGTLTAFSSDGEQLWSVESAAGESIEALLTDNEGNLLALGTYPFVDPSQECEPQDLSCERRALVLHEYDDAGNELWSRHYELAAHQPPQFKQPSLLRGTWVGGKLVVLGWNADDGQPWLGSFAY